MPKEYRVRRFPFPRYFGHFHWQIFYAKRGLRLGDFFFLSVIFVLESEVL